MARVSLSEAVRRQPVSPNGATPSTPGLTAATPVRRRPMWALLGAGLVALAMLLGAWVFATNARTVSVLVTANDLAPGQVLGAGDLDVLELSGAGGLRGLEPGRQDLIVGRAARGPIPAGTVLNVDLFAARDEVVPAGQIVVGVALEPGASPSSRLAAGDRVEVLAVARTTGGAVPDAQAEVVTVGSVWSVEPIGTGSSTAGKVWVSLLVPQSAHAAVAQAAADGRLRLGLLGSAG